MEIQLDGSSANNLETPVQAVQEYGGVPRESTAKDRDIVEMNDIKVQVVKEDSSAYDTVKPAIG